MATIEMLLARSNRVHGSRRKHITEYTLAQAYLALGGDEDDLVISPNGSVSGKCTACLEYFMPTRMLTSEIRDGVFCRTCHAIIEDFARIKATPQHALAVKEYGNFGTDTIEIAECLIEATEEGRLCDEYAIAIGVETGNYECNVCGMKNWTQDEAIACCRPARPGEPLPTAGVNAWRYTDYE